MAPFAEAVIQTFLPSECCLCGTSLPWRGSRAGVCGACWETIVPFAGSCCPVCGELDVSSEDECLGCRVQRPRWTGAVSYGAYEGALRDLVLLLKHGRRDELAGPLAARMAWAWRRASTSEVDAVAGVPMRPFRRLRRGFNQAELLASAVARELGLPVVKALRRRGTLRQVGRPRSQRRSLPPSEFAPAPGCRGRDLLLVDDVMTTGGTAAAATTALLRGGTSSVHVLTLARTPRFGRIS